MIFCDRLEQLKDSKSEHSPNWFPEMTLSVKSEPLNKLIQGRADNCLAYGKQKSDLHTALIVLYVFSLYEILLHTNPYLEKQKSQV
jgi:hypothetical protein